MGSRKISIKAPKPDEMCPVGFHIVRGHNRTCHSGTKTWVDAHNAKNPARGKLVYLSENLSYLYWNADLKKYHDLKAIKGFPAHHELDALIQFWLDYWRLQGLKYPDDLDPLVVKAMVAYESSFNPSATSNQSTATGLIQMTNTARLDLSGRKLNGGQYIKDQAVSITQADLKDPLINIAAAMRWLAAKYGSIPSRQEKTTFNLLQAYNSQKEGTKYAEKIMQLYQQSK